MLDRGGSNKYRLLTWVSPARAVRNEILMVIAAVLTPKAGRPFSQSSDGLSTGVPDRLPA